MHIYLRVICTHSFLYQQKWLSCGVFGQQAPLYVGSRLLLNRERLPWRVRYLRKTARKKSLPHRATSPGWRVCHYFAIALTLAAKRDFLRAALFLWRTPF